MGMYYGVLALLSAVVSLVVVQKYYFYGVFLFLIALNLFIISKLEHAEERESGEK